MSIRVIPYATRVIFGAGALAELPQLLQQERVRRPLMLLDPGVRKAGIENRVLEALGHAGPADRLVLTAVDEAIVTDIAARACQVHCDGVIAVGGGSVIDAAKLVSLAMATRRPLARFAQGSPHPAPWPQGMPPVICVPTTAGTGSDLSRGAALMSDGGRLVLMDRKLAPRASVCDPGLTTSMPATLTAATALDAFSHCLEGYLSPQCGAPYESVAVAGMQRISSHLPRVLSHPQDLQARGELMMGAIEGAMAMPLGLGAMHGLAVPMDGPGVHHGTVVGILAPHVLAFYERYGEPKLESLREIFRLRARRGAVSGAFARLLEATGLPSTLSAAGVTAELAAQAVRYAPTSPYHRNSPIQPTPLEYEQLIAEAM